MLLEEIKSSKYISKTKKKEKHESKRVRIFTSNMFLERASLSNPVAAAVLKLNLQQKRANLGLALKEEELVEGKETKGKNNKFLYSRRKKEGKKEIDGKILEGKIALINSNT